MNLVVITGLPASGKSRLAAAVKETFGWPVFSKDVLKEKLFDTVGFSNYAEKRALDHAANEEILSVLETLLQSGANVVIDNNFDRISAEKLTKLIETYHPNVAVVELTGDIELFYRRYVKRDSLQKRHPGHALQDHYPLKEGEAFSFSMTMEEYKERFVDRGMASADWAPDRIVIDVSGGELILAEALEKIREKLNGKSEPAGSESEETFMRPADCSEPPVVAIPFRSFPSLVGEGVVRSFEEAGFRVKANRTGRKLSEEEMTEMVHDAYAIVAGSEKYSGALIRSAKNVKVMIRFGVGLDNIDLGAVKECGISLGVIANDAAVAEHALMLTLAILRREPTRDAEIRSGVWSHEPLSELRNKTVGLLGFGRIGQRFASYLQGFDVTIQAYDPYFNKEAGERLHVRPVSLDELFRTSDVLSLHLPGNAENESIINAETLAKMKPGAVLINTARGVLVDEEALVEALNLGHLAGAALDAFRKEPLPSDSPLLAAPNLILSPHTAALTKETNEEACKIVFHSILSVRNGKKPDHPVRL